MKSGTERLNVLIILIAMCFLSGIAFADDGTYKNVPGDMTDSISYSRRLIHRLGVDGRPTYIFPTNSFLRGDNMDMKPIRKSISAHLKYSFQYYPNSYTDRIYRSSYQGLGLAMYSFDNKEEIGTPFALYLFQGARIAQLNPRLSFNYEWNFGASFGWKPYEEYDNPYNKVIGSKINAYINANFYLNYILSKELDLTAGVDLTHFSNGNTRFPNAGLNTVGLKVGLVYNFNRNGDLFSKPFFQPPVPRFPRHISYDVVLFGSWRRKGVYVGEGQVAAPGAFAVAGFNINPMYNFGYNFRAGVSLDGVYDESANIYADPYSSSSTEQFYRPPLSYQLALGLSARAEYVMPYFTVGIGLGGNVIHRGGDLKGLYQVLALKIEVTRSSFIHIGYNLQNFHTPNYLMLGIGYRFHNKYPTFHR